MENTLLVHIGTPKTGTTALQKFLKENDQQLRKRGWCYPDLPTDWRTINGIKMKTPILPKNGNMVKFSVKDEWAEWEKNILWKIIKNYLKHYNVIMSDEGMWNLYFEPVMKEIRKRYSNVKIICYLRRQDLYMESKWNQTVKENLLSEDIDYLYSLRKEEVDYKKRLEWLSELFGKENIIVRVYEKGQFEGVRSDITSDFLESCGIGSDWEEVILPGSVNERIDSDVLGLKYIFNREYMKLVKKDIRESSGPIVNNNFFKMNLKGSDKGVGYVPMDFRKKILTECEPDNEYIAREYLGRENGKLFYNMETDIPCYTPDFTEREEEIVKLFTGIFAEQEQRCLLMEQKGLFTQVLNKIPVGIKMILRKIRIFILFPKLKFK